jgi:hypothetical protein
MLNLGVALFVVRGIYYRSAPRKEFVFAFLSVNTSVFLIATLLGGIELSVGFGFGLFAILSVLRYRTDPIPVREMTYLFVLMALPVIDAMLLSQSAYAAMLIANAVAVLVLYAGEMGWGFHYEQKKTITYERIELIKPENYERLLADLCERTGLPIARCEVGKIDFLRDVAEVKIYYREPAARTAARRAQAPGPRTTAETVPVRQWNEGDARS